MGILISSLAKDELKNIILTFESNPRFFEIKGDTLCDKIKSLRQAPWGGSTNFTQAIMEILNLGIKHNLSNEQMPKRLIVISDMQFDQANNNKQTNFDEVKQLYEHHNYILPHIVFWNVNGKVNDIPVLSNETKVSLVSGFSTEILKAVLNNENITPYSTMQSAINIPRYDVLKLKQNIYQKK